MVLCAGWGVNLIGRFPNLKQIVFNIMLREWGVRGVQVNEVVPLDAIFDSSPTSTFGLIFLSRYSPNTKKKQDIEVSHNLWFANQVCQHPLLPSTRPHRRITDFYILLCHCGPHEHHQQRRIHQPRSGNIPVHSRHQPYASHGEGLGIRFFRTRQEGSQLLRHVSLRPPFSRPLSKP